MLDNEILKKLSLTRLSVILAEQFMNDNIPHSRQQIIAYVKDYAENNNLPIPENTHISGAIQELAAKGICEKVSTGIYVLPNTDDESLINNKIERLMAETEKYIFNMRKVIKNINFVTANEDELRLLNAVREHVQCLDIWYKEFESLLPTENEEFEGEETEGMGMTL